MKLSHIVKAIGHHGRASLVLPRYAAMVGIEVTDSQCNYAPTDPREDMEIDAESARQILALDYAERQTENLRAMGEGIGKLSINVPGNINVWQHLKGESSLRHAAESLAAAAATIVERASK